VTRVLRDNILVILVDRQGGQWTLTETHDVKALMAKFAQVCSDGGILGVTDPDTFGKSLPMRAIGKV
jgi:hypothetical protein